MHVQQLKKQQDKKQQWLQKGHGEYQFLQDEKEFFAAMKGEEKMVCHFFRDNWPCKVMDKHIGILCKQHLECKFTKVRPAAPSPQTHMIGPTNQRPGIEACVQIDAEKSPYLTDKLKIWMLPTLALVKNEKVVDYVVGLDDLGGRDDFTTEVLAGRLAAAGVITFHTGDKVAGSAGEQRNVRKGAYVAQKGADDEDSDFD